MTRLVMLAAFLVACSSKGDSGPPCDKVVEHMTDLMKQAMPGHDIDTMAPRKTLIDQCEKRKLPASARKCMLEAKKFNDLAPCQPKATKAPTPPAPTPTPTAPPSGTQAPAGSANPTEGSAAPAPAPAAPAAGSGG